jgi:hypothetical protein
MIKPMQEKKLLNIFASTNKAHQPEVRFWVHLHFDF